ncbi:MAG: hypothetical protein J6A52_05265 [Bacilli bacterium]|nr:hypothetical protein [Bacilli bacterium]
MDAFKGNILEFSNILDKYIKKDKINHAYLIETNFDNRIEIAKELVKKILSFEENNNIEQLNINYDLQILKTDLQTIKKEEILKIKENFKTKSIYNSKRIYIIEEAEKLNSSSANTLLKFLEEPEENIIAILITSNRNIVINTIVSRCQIIRYYVKEKLNFGFNFEEVEKLFNIIMCIEEKKEQSIAYINDFDIKDLSDRQNFAELLNNMLYVYNDVLHKKIGLPIQYFEDNEDFINKIADKNTIITIKVKTNAISECIERIKYNANMKLLLDKLIILMTGVDINVSSNRN